MKNETDKFLTMTLAVSPLIEKLIKKAAEVEKSEDAMRFSQAAYNAANAMCALKDTE